MMKRNVLIMIFAFLILASCNDDNDGIGNDRNSFVPSNIYSKTLHLRKEGLKIAEFTPSFDCTILELPTIIKLTSTPSYTYSRKSSTEAGFELRYSTRLQVGSDYTNSSYTYKVTLNFTSVSEGTYINIRTKVSSGNIPVFNGTKTETIDGLFSLD